MISFILKGLPLSVSVNGKAPNEVITVKFVHDSIKNFYLIKQIEEEILDNKIETISIKEIVSDHSLLKFMAERV